MSFYHNAFISGETSYVANINHFSDFIDKIIALATKKTCSYSIACVMRDAVKNCEPLSFNASIDNVAPQFTDRSSFGMPMLVSLNISSLLCVAFTFR